MNERKGNQRLCSYWLDSCSFKAELQVNEQWAREGDRWRIEKRVMEMDQLNWTIFEAKIKYCFFFVKKKIQYILYGINFSVQLNNN